MQLPQMSVERRNFAWFAMAYAEQCRLLCCRLTQQGTQCIEQRGILIKQEEERTATQGSTQDIEEHELGFANATMEWLNRNAAEHEMARLVIFASPRMLHLLEEASFQVNNAHFVEAGEDLLQLQVDALADHQLVRDVLRARHSR